MSYPEHEKMKAISDKSQAIGEFLNWLTGERALVIAKWYNERLFPEHYSIESVLAEYFEIDLNKIEKEKRAMLESMRESNRPKIRTPNRQPLTKRDSVRLGEEP